MNRIDQRFSELQAAGKRALIIYLTAGFPNPEATLGYMQAIERGGADLIELGIPFSDPVADGPTIQRASSEALDAGMTLKRAIETVAEFRRTSQLPLILFGAYNPFFRYGLEELARDASQAGVDGILIADLPPEECDEVKPFLEAAGLHYIPLIAPTTLDERAAEIARTAHGFIYYISLKGVTGARTALATDLEQPLQRIKKSAAAPVAVGFGISNPEQAAMVGSFADGVVVGSALIDLISKNRGSADLPTMLEDYIRSMKSALPVGTGSAA